MGLTYLYDYRSALVFGKLAAKKSGSTCNRDPSFHLALQFAFRPHYKTIVVDLQLGLTYMQINTVNKDSPQSTKLATASVRGQCSRMSIYNVLLCCGLLLLGGPRKCSMQVWVVVQIPKTSLYH